LLTRENMRSCEQDKKLKHVNGLLSAVRFGRTLQIHTAGVEDSPDSLDIGHMIRAETFLIFAGSSYREFCWEWPSEDLIRAFSSRESMSPCNRAIDGVDAGTYMDWLSH
jgi:hypothetical protein